MKTRSKDCKTDKVGKVCCKTCAPTSHRGSGPTEQPPTEKKSKKGLDCGEKKKKATSDKPHKKIRKARAPTAPSPQIGLQKKAIDRMTPPYDLDEIYGLLVDKKKEVKEETE